MCPDDDADPPPLTVEEIEDVLANGIDFSAALAALIAELEQMPDGPDQPFIVDDPPPPEDRP